MMRWTYYDTSYLATMEDGRVSYLQYGSGGSDSFYSFTYDVNKYLKTIRDGYNGELELTWNGDNIVKAKYKYKRYGEESYTGIWTSEYTYSRYPASLLACINYLNPCFDYVYDYGVVVWQDMAGSLLGAFGPVNKNLPQTATFYNKDGKIVEFRNYSYKIDSDGYPTGIIITGEGTATKGITTISLVWA